MKFFVPVLCLFVFQVAAELSAGFKATVYEGPKECDDADKVKAGNYLKMHYTGTIDESSPTGKKGSKFDSSRDRGQTFDFTIGQGQVIKGWDEGIPGLCKGAKATLIIPAEDGYGESGAGGAIPGGATLNFDVEVVDILAEAPEGAGGADINLFAELDADGDKKLTKEEIRAYFVKQAGDPEAQIPEGLWDGEDKDKDGSISWTEFSGPKGHEEL